MTATSINSTPDFLARILAQKSARLAQAREQHPFELLRAAALDVRQTAAPHRLQSALKTDERLNVIAEFKRASPSKGVIRTGLDPAVAARKYEEGGAAAISVLTEEDYFQGSLEDLREVRAATRLPVLRKDFIFDEYQIYEAAAAGADALLLIVAALNEERLAGLRCLTEDELGMDALVEVHTRSELEQAHACGATLIGVNNRDLRSFNVSLDVSIELIREAPRGLTFISESGLRSGEDLRRLRARGFQGFLIGETLMRADKPEQALRALLDEEA
ncbi:MAG: indole-3-glycerol phosphate synthase TrpC [Pyrinomonadaceae bacterium]